MRSEKFTRTYVFEPEQTCKTEWIFTLSNGPDGTVIEDLQIKAHINESGKPRGCLGHPGTIETLIRGLPIASINAEALAQAGCARDVACGQALAQCLTDLLATTKAG